MHYILLGSVPKQFLKIKNVAKYALIFTKQEHYMLDNIARKEENIPSNAEFLYSSLANSGVKLVSVSRALDAPLSVFTSEEQSITYIPNCSLDNILFLKKILKNKHKFIFCVDSMEDIVDDNELLEILYQIPNLVVASTKKSSIKNFIDLLASAENPAGVNPYAFRPYLMGLDISMNSTGVACTATNFPGDTKILVGKLRTKKTRHDIERYPQIVKAQKGLLVRDLKGNTFVINMHYAHKFCIEGGALAMVHGAFRLGMFSGMFLSNLYADSKQFYYVSPRTLKKFITGYGAAKKGLMKICIKRMLKVGIDINDDEADALSLLHCLVADAQHIFTK